jgi:hypothetical protein
VEHIIRAFVLALVGLGTAVGIGGMCVLAATLDVLFRNDFEPLLDGVTASGFVIALAGMLILVKHRRRFMRIRPARRLGVSVLCWIPTLSIVGFLLWWR